MAAGLLSKILITFHILSLPTSFGFRDSLIHLYPIQLHIISLTHVFIFNSCPWIHLEGEEGQQRATMQTETSREFESVVMLMVSRCCVTIFYIVRHHELLQPVFVVVGHCG